MKKVLFGFVLVICVAFISCKKDCNAPTELSVSNITDSSAVLSWNGSAESFELTVNGTTTEISENSINLTNLQANSVVNISLKAICKKNSSDIITYSFSTRVADTIPEGPEDPNEPIDSNSIENITINNIPEGTHVSICGGTSLELTHAAGGYREGNFEFFAADHALETIDIYPWIFLKFQPSLGLTSISEDNTTTQIEYCQSSYLMSGSTIRGDWWFSTAKIKLFNFDITNNTLSGVIEAEMYNAAERYTDNNPNYSTCSMRITMKDLQIESFE